MAKHSALMRASNFTRTSENTIMTTSKSIRPGTIADTSGQYRNNTTRTEVTVTKGEPMPPTPGAGQTYTLVDKTKHKR